MALNLVLDARVECSTAFVTCRGAIVHGATARRFRTCIGSLLLGYEGVVLDLGAVTYMDARGAGMVAVLIAQAKAADRRLLLARSSDRVKRVLRLTRLDVELHSESSVTGARFVVSNEECGVVGQALFAGHPVRPNGREE
jgi:anti-anti-sigma factor